MPKYRNSINGTTIMFKFVLLNLLIYLSAVLFLVDIFRTEIEQIYFVSRINDGKVFLYSISWIFADSFSFLWFRFCFVFVKVVRLFVIFVLKSPKMTL
ncbi:hypothetical protein MsAc7_11860 [Methanolapillus millepedarum]|uniref:Uncharacterized protein n=1 Tax=Methanolapillus millepedarum TaxID=3028296 RepID=A0AA96V360_9EURY|nr:hypothetical protein MsAc7_11860 [Methanosarcinaceae archaeon Ac7]